VHITWRHETSHHPIAQIKHRKTHLIKFLLRIRGAFTAAPTRELPVSQIPQAAPTTEKPKPKAIPKLAHP
jgi:hypothetical protein